MRDLVCSVLGQLLFINIHSLRVMTCLVWSPLSVELVYVKYDYDIMGEMFCQSKMYFVIERPCFRHVSYEKVYGRPSSPPKTSSNAISVPSLLFETHLWRCQIAQPRISAVNWSLLNNSIARFTITQIVWSQTVLAVEDSSGIWKFTFTISICTNIFTGRIWTQHLPLFQRICACTFIAWVIQAAILSQRWQWVPRWSLMAAATLWSQKTLARTWTECRAAGTPSVWVPKPLSSGRFADTRCTSWRCKASNL